MVTQRIYVYPPKDLIKLCTIGEYRGKTNGELVEDGMVVRKVMTACNAANVNTYRKWLESGK